ncbi:MAG: hypothetical protein ACXACY_24920 [Candidatus Hodarchaeales archaeon]|jgi:RecJ-like exonuclease
MLYEGKEIVSGNIILCPMCSGVGFYMPRNLINGNPNFADDDSVSEKVICGQCDGDGRVTVRLKKVRKSS